MFWAHQCKAKNRTYIYRAIYREFSFDKTKTILNFFETKIKTSSSLYNFVVLIHSRCKLLILINITGQLIHITITFLMDVYFLTLVPNFDSLHNCKERKRSLWKKGRVNILTAVVKLVCNLFNNLDFIGHKIAQLQVKHFHFTLIISYNRNF